MKHEHLKLFAYSILVEYWDFFFTLQADALFKDKTNCTTGPSSQEYPSTDV